ncbi:phosphotransferase [Limosilactobacillus kribbianus]|uniref:phosphotransferase n=1 Tax=Limosilactobacillus kribbianus TaxID=2982695 RepID=UPI002264C7E9|nr:phosphotransferase [Limosilactobacillus kribbianus]
MNGKLLKIFKMRLAHPQATQRELAQLVGLSLGKVNQGLDQLKQLGLLNAQSELTSAGQDYIECHHPQRAVILAAGYGMRMVPINTEEPKGLLEVNGEPLIERVIKQLHHKQIRDIQIVVGFMKEHYEYLIDKYDVQLIVNAHYAEWKNIYSLYLARHSLANSYILPCDIWFKNNPFSTIEDRSWYLFADEEAADSVWRVNSQGKVSRAKKQTNRMVGLAYINDQDAGKLVKRLAEHEQSQQGLREFWEEALVNQGKFQIDGKLISADDYTEINSYEELRDLDGSSNHLKNDAISAIEQSLDVSVQEIHDIRVLKKGMTNRSFIFRCRGKHYIMRIPGEGTAKLINRQQEYDVYQQIKKLSYVERTLYLNPQNGYKLTQFIENSHNCDAQNWDEVHQCMQLLRHMHNQKLKVDHQFDAFKQLEFYEQLRHGQSAYRDYAEVKARVLALKKFIDFQDKEWTLCHIDANPDNFVFDQDNDLYLIDWEYAGMQDPHIDIAMFAIYAIYNQEQLDRLIDSYFEKSIDQQVRYKIYAYVAVCGLLWSNWCEYKQSLGLDFGEYSLAQYRYAKEYSKKVINYLNEVQNGNN